MTGPALPGALPPPELRRRARILSSVGLLALLVSAAVGGNLFGSRDRIFGEDRAARPAAVSRDAQAGPAAAAQADGATKLRSQPWWQKVTVLSGAGSQRGLSARIASGALQWRVKPACAAGRLTVELPGRRRPVLSTACPPPADTFGYGTSTGLVSLDVEATRKWELVVEQQVDIPLVEPPTAAMQDPATVSVAKVVLYRIDQTGTGGGTIYRLRDGSHALRLEDFFVTPNVDLEIKLSPLPAPRTTPEFVSAPSVFVARLDITTGSLNFVIPASIDPMRYRSIVIWCEVLHSAYAGATLAPLR